MTAEQVWSAYLASRPALGDLPLPPVERFGDSDALTDELAALVVHGPKRATASLVAEYAAEGEAMPVIGEHWMVEDSTGTVLAVLRTTELRIGRLDSVDDAFAWDEGEGDRTRASWLDGHRRYFARSCERISHPADDLDALEVLFERFTLVWSA